MSPAFPSLLAHSRLAAVTSPGNFVRPTMRRRRAGRWRGFRIASGPRTDRAGAGTDDARSHAGTRVGASVLSAHGRSGPASPRRRGPSLRRGRGEAGGVRAGPCGSLPSRACRAHAGARALRLSRAAGVRGAQSAGQRLRARDRGALPGLDVAGGRDQQPHDDGADRLHARDRRAAPPLPAAFRARRAPRRSLPHRAACGFRCSGHPHARAPRRRALRRERQQDVHHERPRGQCLRPARGDGSVGATAPPRDVVLRRREGTSRLPGREVAVEAGLQGRRHRRALLRGLRRARRRTWWAASRAAGSRRS